MGEKGCDLGYLGYLGSGERDFTLVFRAFRIFGVVGKKGVIFYCVFWPCWVAG